nr:InlB B-repeat-containing protein [[Ruminococcus] lactaris]
MSYDANGGSGAPDSQTKTYGTNLTLSDVIPIRSNYNFKGWATTNTATTATYAAGGVYTENAKVTLYAVWELAYWIPKIKSINIARCDTNGTMDSYGTCAKISFDWECCQITGVNNISSITIGYVLSDPASVTNVNVPVSGISGSVSKVIGSDQLSTDDQYTIIITAKDSKNGVSSAEIVLSKSSFTMDILAGGKGIAIGKPAEDENLFDVGWDLKARKEVYDKFGSRICNGLASYIGTGDDGIDPDTTVDQLVITDKNVPVNGLAYVESMFFDKKSTDTNRSQIAVPYSAEDSLYHRHYYNGSWSEWRRANVVDQKVLWNGAYYLTSNQTAVLSEPISAQSNGIMLVFADLDSSGNGEESWAAQQGYWAYFIPKQAVADFSGRFWTCSTQWWSAIAPQLVIKGFYVTDTKITGHSISVTKTDTVNGTRSVLRRIYGV